MTPPRKPRRIWIAPIVLIVLGFVSVLAFVSMLRATPAYWQPLDTSEPRVQQAAQAVEGFVTTQTTAVRPAEAPWAIELSEDQVNAWLASRLPQWLANQGADPRIAQAVPRVMMHFEPGAIELAAEVSFNGKAQLVRAVYEPTAVDQGATVRLRLQGLYAGRVPLPRRAMIEQLATRTRQDPEKVRGLIETVELRLPLADHRRVHVVGVELHEGRIVLVCVTQ